ncbi:MAG: hypothetical protein KGQ28_11615, partial [Hyphomicrobiales bacterium]|nr:hypothetical protein [Hyphomicrobiales bacterium]
MLSTDTGHALATLDRELIEARIAEIFAVVCSDDYVDRLVSMMAEDVHYEIVGDRRDNPSVGVWRGKEAVRAAFRDIRVHYQFLSI